MKLSGALRDLAGCPDVDLDGSVLRGVYAVAVRTADVDLLAALASRTDLPSDVLAELSRIPAAKVRVAYLSRTDRPLAELRAAVASETRTTVLAAVAASPEVSGALLDDLATAPGRAVAWAVLRNPGSPDEARVAALLSMEQYVDDLGYAPRRELSDLIAGWPQLHDRLARRWTSVSLLADISSSPHLSEPAQDRLVELLVVDTLRRAAQLSKDVRRRVAAVSLRYATALASNPALSSDVLARIRTVRATTSLWDAVPAASLDDVLDEAERLGRAGRDLVVARRLAAGSLSDPERLMELVEAVAGSSEPDLGLAFALIDNPDLPLDGAVQLVVSAGSPLASHVLRDPDRRAPEVLAEALSVSPGWFGEDLLDAGEVPLLRAMVDLVARGGLPDWLVLRIMNAVTASPLLDVATFRRIPWTAVPSPLPQRGATLLAALLEEHLGDHPARWELLAGLSPGFSGSVGELLDAAALLDTASDTAS